MLTNTGKIFPTDCTPISVSREHISSGNRYFTYYYSCHSTALGFTSNPSPPDLGDTISVKLISDQEGLTVPQKETSLYRGIIFRIQTQERDLITFIHSGTLKFFS